MIRPGVFFFGVLIPLAVLALVVYGVWELARSRGEVGGGTVVGEAPSGSARLILDERFARGEVDADEYVHRRALLDGTVPSPPLGAVGVPPPSSAADVVQEPGAEQVPGTSGPDATPPVDPQPATDPAARSS